MKKIVVGIVISLILIVIFAPSNASGQAVCPTIETTNTGDQPIETKLDQWTIISLPSIIQDIWQTTGVTSDYKITKVCIGNTLLTEDDPVEGCYSAVWVGWNYVKLTRMCDLGDPISYYVELPATATPNVTATPTITATPIPTATPTITVTPTATATPVPTATPLSFVQKIAKDIQTKGFMPLSIIIIATIGIGLIVLVSVIIKKRIR